MRSSPRAYSRAGNGNRPTSTRTLLFRSLSGEKHPSTCLKLSYFLVCSCVRSSTACPDTIVGWLHYSVPYREVEAYNPPAPCTATSLGYRHVRDQELAMVVAEPRLTSTL